MLAPGPLILTKIVGRVRPVERKQPCAFVEPGPKPCPRAAFVIECQLVKKQQAREARVAAVVLAAGGSTRMRQPKLLMPLGEEPMVRLVVNTVLSAGLDRVIVVIGSRADAIRKALAGLPVEIVENQEWSTGLSTSLRVGLLALEPEPDAALVVLADQPGLSRELVRALVRTLDECDAAIVAPSFGGRRANPVLFKRHLFSELLAAEGDSGGREVISRHEGAMKLVEVDDPLLLQDVDTIEDYVSLRELYDRSP